ncbi:MAG TPA: hypothetical protein VL500_05270 [Candidatus Eisenbacteria bacterium]|nr:hypothetical protein [Candidatus Eisenbacteria bacterium]
MHHRPVNDTTMQGERERGPGPEVPWDAGQEPMPAEPERPDGRPALSAEEKAAADAAEHRERVKRIAEARAAIEATRNFDVTEKDLEEVRGLSADLEEINEIADAIRMNIGSGTLAAGALRNESARLEALGQEREAVLRRIRDIKSGVPEARRTAVDRRVGIGRETRPEPPPKAPWWKRMFGKK